MRKIILAGLTASALVGCPQALGTAANAAMGASGSPIVGGLGQQSDYFPLDRTFTWVYATTIQTSAATQSAQDTLAITAVSGTAPDRTASYTWSRSAGGATTEQVPGTITTTATTITIAGTDGQEIIDLPLSADQQWTSGALSARTFDVPTLTVEGVTYQHLIGIAYSQGSAVQAVRWLAPGVGIVQEAIRSTVDGNPVVTTSELLSARVSAVTAVSLTPVAGLHLAIGQTASASAVAIYADGSSGHDCTLVMADPGIASVTQDGLVTALASGSTLLTALSKQDSKQQATVSVVVN